MGMASVTARHLGSRSECRLSPSPRYLAINSLAAMKSFLQTSYLWGSIRVAVHAGAILLLAPWSRAVNSVTYTAPVIVTTASSGATCSGNFQMTVTYGTTPTLALTWNANGQSAVEPSGSGNAGKTDLPGFGFDVFDLTTHTDLGNAYLASSGQVGYYGIALTFSPPSASGNTFWFNGNGSVNYSDQLQITENAITGILGGYVNNQQQIYVVTQTH